MCVAAPASRKGGDFGLRASELDDNMKNKNRELPCNLVSRPLHSVMSRGLSHRPHKNRKPAASLQAFAEECTVISIGESLSLCIRRECMRTGSCGPLFPRTLQP